MIVRIYGKKLLERLDRLSLEKAFFAVSKIWDSVDDEKKVMIKTYIMERAVKEKKRDFLKNVFNDFRNNIFQKETRALKETVSKETYANYLNVLAKSFFYLLDCEWDFDTFRSLFNVYRLFPSLWDVYDYFNGVFNDESHDIEEHIKNFFLSLTDDAKFMVIFREVEILRYFVNKLPFDVFSIMPKFYTEVLQHIKDAYVFSGNTGFVYEFLERYSGLIDEVWGVLGEKERKLLVFVLARAYIRNPTSFIGNNFLNTETMRMFERLNKCCMREIAYFWSKLPYHLYDFIVNYRKTFRKSSVLESKEFFKVLREYTHERTIYLLLSSLVYFRGLEKLKDVLDEVRRKLKDEWGEFVVIPSTTLSHATYVLEYPFFSIHQLVYHALPQYNYDVNDKTDIIDVYVGDTFVKRVFVVRLFNGSFFNEIVFVYVRPDREKAYVSSINVDSLELYPVHLTLTKKHDIVYNRQFLENIDVFLRLFTAKVREVDLWKPIDVFY